mmetsp:Transcript_16445/g.27656  ORF Transcript_16445/g.27656 Transcript_16445/m.27656 type:complete len:388 (-) Transcript_16445:2663-3826(-)
MDLKARVAGSLVCIFCILSLTLLYDLNIVIAALTAKESCWQSASSPPAESELTSVEDFSLTSLRKRQSQAHILAPALRLSSQADANFPSKGSAYSTCPHPVSGNYQKDDVSGVFFEKATVGLTTFFYGQLAPVGSRNSKFAVTAEFFGRSKSERSITRFVEKKVIGASACVVFDVGTNAGWYTLLAGKGGCTVYGFEPKPLCNQVLRASVRHNHLENVRLYPKGVSSTYKVFPVPPSKCSSGSFDTSRLKKISIEDQPIGLNEVSTVSLDQVSFACSVEEITWLKIDVDCAEMDVLLSAVELFRARRVVWTIVEVNSPGCWKLSGVSIARGISILSRILVEFGYFAYAETEWSRWIDDTLERAPSVLADAQQIIQGGNVLLSRVRIA